MDVGFEEAEDESSFKGTEFEEKFDVDEDEEEA